MSLNSLKKRGVNFKNDYNHLNQSLDGAREIQVIDFLRIARHYYIIVKEPQRLFNVDNNWLELTSLDVLKRSLKTIDKGTEIIESNGDWYIKSSFKLGLGRKLHTQLGVPKNSYSW